MLMILPAKPNHLMVVVFVEDFALINHDQKYPYQQFRKDQPEGK